MASKIYERSREAQKHDKEWTPAALEEVTRRTAVGRKLQVVLTGDYQGQVVSPTARYFCNVTAGTCDCGVFQDCGIPCAHACAVILKEYAMRKSGPAVEDFINGMYSTHQWRDGYSHVMPVITPDHLPPSATPCNPPVRANIGAGRYNSKRIASVGEASSSSQAARPPKTRKPSVCTKCKGMGGLGHNRKTCTWTFQQEAEVLEDVDSEVQGVL